MNQVTKADPYNPGRMGSLGDASGMLIRQYKFPFEYEFGIDKLVSADSDRISYWCGIDRTSECCKRRTGRGSMGIGDWVRNAKIDDIVAFLTEMLDADSTVMWTGFRVLGTVNRSNGYPIFTLELFSKGKTKTKVYSNENAPNVKTVGNFYMDW